MLVISNIEGVSEPFTDFQSLSVRQKINENYELNFVAVKTKDNSFSYDLLKDNAMITLNDENFIVKSVQETPYSKSIIALHEFFEISDDFVENELADNFYTINQALRHAFSLTTDWTYQVEGAFERAFLSNFGKDNPISLLNTIIEYYGVEYTVSSVDRVVKINNRIGQLTDEQVRFKYNLTSIQRDIDSNSVKTAVKVYYNADSFGGYRGSFTYTSPLSNQYRRIKYSPPIYLDNVTSLEEATRYAQNSLQDTPIVSNTVEFTQLKSSGYNQEQIGLGDSFFLIDERLKLEDETRVVEIESYPFDKDRSPTVITSNAKRNVENLSINQVVRQNDLNNSAVKKGNIYNGASINDDQGILIRGRNGVTIRLNADIGFLIENGLKQEFYLDTNGNVNFDGRLNITENGQTHLEAYLDEFGGRLIINDVDGRPQVTLGSEQSGGANQGGTIRVYDDLGQARAALSVLRATGGGAFSMTDGQGRGRVGINADNGFGPNISLFNSSGVSPTFLNEREGNIGGEKIATEAWVRANFAPL